MSRKNSRGKRLGASKHFFPIYIFNNRNKSSPLAHHLNCTHANSLHSKSLKWHQTLAFINQHHQTTHHTNGTHPQTRYTSHAPPKTPPHLPPPPNHLHIQLPPTSPHALAILEWLLFENLSQSKALARYNNFIYAAEPITTVKGISHHFPHVGEGVV